jgi:two-component system cell cycle response regulator CtrA
MSEDLKRQHEIDRARIDALEAELDVAHEKIRALNDQFLHASYEAPLELELTATEERVFAMLAKREQISSKEQLMFSLYSGRATDEEPEPKIVDVMVCKIRRKIAPFGLTIETAWGRGYVMPKASRDKLAAWEAAKAAAA